MAVTNRSLFSWNDVENLPDLKRLSLVLDYIPDEKIVQAIEKNRGNGRDDFPVGAFPFSCISKEIEFVEKYCQS